MGVYPSHRSPEGAVFGPTISIIDITGCLNTEHRIIKSNGKLTIWLVKLSNQSSSQTAL